MADNFIEVFDKKEFRTWLSKNHKSEKRVGLILYKKHTGKNSPSHKELMCEAICFGWIDTTIKRLDQERYVRFFCRRSKNSKWSYNTLGYARELMKDEQMSPEGIKFYEEGLRKIPHDYDVPKDPKPSKEFLRELNKNKKAKENFKIISPSSRKTYLRWLFRAKRPETKLKRTKEIIKELSLVKKKPRK